MWAMWGERIPKRGGSARRARWVGASSLGGSRMVGQRWVSARWVTAQAATYGGSAEGQRLVCEISSLRRDPELRCQKLNTRFRKRDLGARQPRRPPALYFVQRVGRHFVWYEVALTCHFYGSTQGCVLGCLVALQHYTSTALFPFTSGEHQGVRQPRGPT